MRVIDAQSGVEVRVGQVLRGQKLVSVDGGLFSARAYFESAPGDLRRVDLQVRYLHPSFFLQRIGFIPS